MSAEKQGDRGRERKGKCKKEATLDKKCKIDSKRVEEQ
jgi:hypothetical protein